MATERGAERIGRRVAVWSIKARWVVIPLTILVCLVIAYGASALRFAGDYRVFFGPDNPDFIANERAQGTFGKNDNVAFVLIPKGASIYTPDTLQAVHALTEGAWRLPYVSRVDSLTNFQNTIGRGDDLIVSDLVPEPDRLTREHLIEIRRTAETEPLLNGFVVSRDGAATVVNAVVQIPAGVPNAASLVAEAARDLRATILADHPDHQIHITGVASLSAAFEQAGMKDAATLIPAVYLLILVVMFLTLRSVAAVIASLLVIALSTLVAMGAGGWMGVQLTPISLSAPTIILTIAVADAIHLIAGIRNRMREGQDRYTAIIDSLALNFAPIAITSATTVVGFLTLNFSDSPPFHHLGTITAAGVLAAWLLTILFLPALLSLLPMGRTAGSAQDRMTVVDAIANLVIARPHHVLVGTLAFSLGAVAFIPTLRLNDQWSQYFDKSLEFRQAIDATEPYFGSDQVEFILDPGAPGAVTDPAFLARVDAFATWLRTRPEVAHVYAVSDIMKRLNRTLNSDDPAFYRLPEQGDLAGQYLLVYELSLPRGLDLTNRVDIDRRSTRVTATMRDISTEETRAFLSAARDWFDRNGNGFQMEATGSKVLFAFVAERNITAMFEGAAWLVGAILVILALSFRSLGVGLISLVPNALPILATFGVWALLVGTVGFSVAAVGAVAVGLIVDYSVHFLAKYLRARREDGADVPDAVRYAFRTAGAAIFATTVILAAGFAVLATSTFKLNADLGLLTALAIVFAMLVNFLLLPSLFLTLAQRARRAASAPSAHS
ncbi:MAG: hypothetical protein RLY86_1886 [Pseudomonadota bacterium]|jgi:predicted RND superfamily exporter protein